MAKTQPSDQDERQVVGYVLADEPDEVAIALLRKQIAMYCGVSGLRLVTVFCDRGVGDDTTARARFFELTRMLADKSMYGVVVPTLDHLSSFSLVRLVLIRMISTAGSQLFVIDDTVGHGATAATLSVASPGQGGNIP
ncbi:recombinase family protein [Kutzneria sp. NPDC051319]|uniref:recombinase family protein n=1 Tax=Kutzneria sp. NPDC051319 TaxID=3155047 RepID=UPI0034388235